MTLAPPVPSAPGPATSRDARRIALDDARFRLFGLVRDIRVEAQHLNRVLAPVRAALLLTDEKARASELKAALDDVSRVLADSRRDVGDRLEGLHQLVDEYPQVYHQSGDAVAQIENQWAEIENALTWTRQPAAADLPRRLKVVDAGIPVIEWQAALLTIPERVTEHLQSKPVGGQVHFHEAFRDEIDDEAQRVEMLRYLREHSVALGCVVDVPNAVLYRIAPDPRRRLASWVALILLATVGGYAFVWVLANGLPLVQLSFGGIGGINASRFPELMAAYWGVLIGAIAHVVVEAVKQDQRSDAGAFLALGDWFLWVHVRELALIIGVLSLFVILVGLATLMPEPGSLTFLTALGAGYSFDSVLGLFVTRFDGSAKAAAAVVTGQLTGSSAGTKNGA